MTLLPEDVSEAPEAETVDGGGSPDKAARRRIPGNLPYTGSAGVLRSVLEKIPQSERPAVFSTDFLATVLGASGGASRPIIPILKATGLLSQSGAPTELYSQFQTESGRSAAALQALKNGYAEMFRRNKYAHKADENTLFDLIIAITGLTKSDPAARAIKNTFQIFQNFAKDARDLPAQPAQSTPVEQVSHTSTGTAPAPAVGEGKPIGLVYNINIVLPETTNVEVFNAIFRSLRNSLL